MDTFIDNPWRNAGIYPGGIDGCAHGHLFVQVGLRRGTVSENPNCPLKGPCGIPVYAGPIPQTSDAILQESDTEAFVSRAIQDHSF